MNEEKTNRVQQTAEAVQTGEAVQVTETMQTADGEKLTEMNQSAETVQTAEDAQATEAEQVAEAVQSAETVQSTETAQPTETMQTGLEDTQEPSELLSKKKRPLPFIVAAVVAIVLLIGISVYSAPANRLQRQLELGNHYLEELDYEQAVVAFETAITIDERCLEAYAGGVEAYLGTGDVNGTQDFYDRALEVLSGQEEFTAEDMEYAVGIYLFAGEVYGDDRDKTAQVLEKGYEVTKEDSRIKDELIENYIQAGREKTQEGSYEKALTVYDRLLELDRENTEMIDDLCDCLNQYIDILMEAKQYDEIRELAEKYRDVAVNVDFASILAQIEELEKIEAENREFMQKVYDLMAAQDYAEGMFEVDGSEEAEAFVERLEEDYYIYIPDDDGSLSGLGAGVYRYEDDEDKGYYFYYGDYVNGERKGKGTEFLKYGTGYELFVGKWDKDAPNGEGTDTLVGFESDNSDTYYNKVISGTLIDGLWDGQVTAILTDYRNGEEFDLSFIAIKGMPTEDKTEEYISEVYWAQKPLEGRYIYAFDYRSSVDVWWYSFIDEGDPVGITGFTE